MFRRHAVPAALALALTLACGLAAAAFAGGRIDIQPTAVPAKIVAGRPADIAFMLRYPNGDPVTHAKPSLVARCGRTRLEIPAARAKQAGLYVAHVTLPREGAWEFQIESKICGNTCRLNPVMALAAVSTGR